MKTNPFLLLIFSLMIIGFLILGGSVGCQDSSDAQKQIHGGQYGTETQRETESTIYNLNQIIASTPLKIKLVSVGVIKKINPLQDGKGIRGHLSLGLEITNTATEPIWFLPEGLHVRLNNTEIAELDANISWDVTGHFTENEIKRGFLLFSVNDTDPDLILEITINLPAPVDEHHQPLAAEHQVNISLPLNQYN